ncbi:nose resistant to fluoxetine protein 6-like [Mya arenaria]|uniref:nose resistant to fluoxetine protein 6-like n=1 Tax=Mya arenaria TaxID=6604 RepID=UPI0022DFC0D2|nr:nose resistant to fluoxetine protein 6-like [Mya arenaria]
MSPGRGIHLVTAAVCGILMLCSSESSAMRPPWLPHSHYSANTSDIEKAVNDFKLKGSSIFSLISEYLDLQALELDSLHNASFDCVNDTMKVINDLKTEGRAIYAEQFLDAEAKIPPGVLQGHRVWVGDYHECINIQPYPTEQAPYYKDKFTGKYFTVNFRSTLYIGVCMPSSCSRYDVQALVSKVLPPGDVQNVYTSDRIEIDSAIVGGLFLCSVIALTALIGTVVDIYMLYHGTTIGKEVIHNNGYTSLDTNATENTGLLADKEFNIQKPDQGDIKRALFKVLKSFSFISNTKKLMNTSTANGPLACLNGLRVVSMFWVIQGHTYAFASSFLQDPLYALKILASRFSFQPILNGTYSVDTFFFLSGLLVCYLALREFSEKGRINWVYYFVHRYWRLTPVYAICLMFFTTVYLIMITGPYQWLILDPDGPVYPSTNECRTYWWSNLLYINNLFPHYGAESNCFGWAWYLANDMQFYVFLSPIVIVLLHKHKKIGLAFCAFLIASCIAARAVTANYYGMNYASQVTKHTDEPYAIAPIYVKPYCRWSVYIIGMLTGYCLHKTKCHLRMNKITVAIGWAVSISMALSVIYGMYYYYSHPGTEPTKTGTIFYISCARTAWGFTLAWLVVACAAGYGGWVNAILSWKFWAPMGRLTYCAYLVHPMIIFGFYLNMVTPIPYSDTTVIYIFISNLVLSYGIAYIVSMAFEAPMMQLEKIILGKA